MNTATAELEVQPEIQESIEELTPLETVLEKIRGWQKFIWAPVRMWKLCVMK
jgi:hypothetical protein